MRGEYSPPRICCVGVVSCLVPQGRYDTLIEAATFLVATIWATIEAGPEPHGRAAMWAFGVGVVCGWVALHSFVRLGFLWHVASAV